MPIMDDRRALPRDFVSRLEELETSYLTQDDPIRQSGFGGGPQRWRAEREPILNAIPSDGDLLDIGCANGYLLECLVAWGRERGLLLIPHGVDMGARLIELARRRLPHVAPNFSVGNAWEWTPTRRFQYVYTLYDCVPPDFLTDYVRRLVRDVVAERGRLILGAYESRSNGIPPFDVSGALRSAGLRVAGTSKGGDPTVSAFAWVNA